VPKQIIARDMRLHFQNQANLYALHSVVPWSLSSLECFTAHDYWTLLDVYIYSVYIAYTLMATKCHCDNVHAWQTQDDIGIARSSKAATHRRLGQNYFQQTLQVLQKLLEPGFIVCLALGGS
jgi:hypothetical protein